MQIRAEESNKLFRYLLVPLGFMGLHPHVGGKFAKVRAAATFVYMLAQYSLTLFKIVLEYDGLRTLREAIMPLPASHQVTERTTVVAFLCFCREFFILSIKESVGPR